MQVQTEQGVETNEIAQAVQNSEADILTLWLACRRYIYQQAARWYKAFDGRRGIELDDLEQAGYEALARAVTVWKPEAGGFLTALTFCLKSSFAATYGMQTTRAEKDPLNNATSLDAALAGTDEDCTLGDTVLNEESERAFDIAERVERCQAVRRAVLRLPPEQREALVAEFWRGERPDPKARSKALRALRHPSVSSVLRTYY